MRRADRLFQIVQYLRGRRLVTARQLADKLEVSERTIYRDVRDLTLSGIPIEGEAGVGYLLRHGADIPPLMFTRDEIEALVVGARMVRAWGGKSLSDSARLALAKIEAALPMNLKEEIDRSRLFAPNFRKLYGEPGSFDIVHRAINQKRVLHFDYTREDGATSSRDVWPLGLFFWAPAWTLAAWCELRDDFRHFRIDRMRNVNTIDRQFADEPGKTLTDFLAYMDHEG
jgi:predicted DNA-binding transcriptional regulator YafY